MITKKSQNINNFFIAKIMYIANNENQQLIKYNKIIAILKVKQK